MSKEVFDDNCPGCKPALIDVQSGKVLANDSHVMILVNKVWAGTTREQREAFHNVCCNNSRDPKDLKLMEEISKAMEMAFIVTKN